MTWHAPDADRSGGSLGSSELADVKHPYLDSLLVVIAAAIGLALCGYAVSYTIWLNS